MKKLKALSEKYQRFGTYYVYYINIIYLFISIINN